MNEISISSAISKLHSIIVSFFLFIFLSLVIIFISAINGIEIKSLKFPSINIEKLYIKWDQKLIVTAQSIEIKTSKKKKIELNYQKKLKNSFDILRNVYEFSDLVQEIDIKKITINDTNISFRYKIDADSFLSIKSGKIKALCRIEAQKNRSIVYINQFENTKEQFHIYGIAIIDNTKEEITSKLHMDILRDANLTLYMYMNTNKLFYSAESHKSIDNLPQIVKILNIPKDINKWIYDATKVKDTNLKTLYGSVNLLKPEEIMQYIYVDADFNALEYTFDTRLAPIITSNTNLIFEKGILHIRPKNGKFHNQDLNNSYADIDFNPDKYLLTLHLQDLLSLDSDVLDLLKTYKVNIPFMQTSSKVDTNLFISVKLENSDTQVDGNFTIGQGTFLYRNMNLDASNGFVRLKGSQVDIKRLKLSYKDSIDTNVSGTLDPNKSVGKIEIDINKMNFTNLILKPNKSKAHLTYFITPKEDNISVSPLLFDHKGDEVRLDAFNMKVNLETLYAKLSRFQVSVSDKLTGFLWGDVNLDKLTANLNLDITKLQYKTIKLDQAILPVSIKYDKKIQINAANKIALKIKDNKAILSPMQLTLDTGKMNIANTNINITDQLSSNFAVDYDTNTSTGSIVLQKVNLKNALLKSFFNKNETYTLSISKKDTDTEIFMNKYNTKLLLQENDLWALRCEDFSKIYKNIPLFKDYNITNGSLTIASTSQDDNLFFSGTLKYPYKLLVKENKPLDTYMFNGSYSPKKTEFKINDDFQMEIANKEIKIKSDNIGFNIPEFVKFSDEHKINTDSKEGMPIILKARNSYLYYKEDRKMLADTLDVQFFNSEITAQLKHQKGNASFNLNKYGLFYLHGSNFDDLFMEKLFATSKFSKGALSFTFNGAFEDFSGIIEIKNTILKEYKALNNVFAFVNTVPSLVTFSVPDYSKKGLHVENMYVGFTAKKGLYDLSDLSLTSKEIKIYGKGTMNLRTDTLDLDMNLKTDLGSKASKIPIVGYILFGKDSLSTSLKVTGSIYDPDVSTTVAKDMIIAPLNIIKRALLLPVELFSPSSKEE